MNGWAPEDEGQYYAIGITPPRFFGEGPENSHF